MDFPRLTSSEFLRRFTLLDVCGHGGFGVVFRAKRAIGDICAVKLIGTDEKCEDAFQELHTIARVAAYSNDIPALARFENLAIVTASSSLVNIRNDDAYVFDRPFCAPSRDEITSFMMYTMPLYVPIVWDELSSNQRGVIHEQMVVALEQFTTYGIRPVDIATAVIPGAEPDYTDASSLNFKWQNIMLVDASRMAVAIVDCDLYEFF